MNPHSTLRKHLLHSPFPVFKYSGLLLLVFFISINPAFTQEKNCGNCSVPAFAALTIYHTLQTGPAIGFGIEAGKWKKDEGKFSYFLGTSMLWSEKKDKNQKTLGSSKELIISFYWKGQYKLTNRFYFVAQPELVNLSRFDLRTGIRFVLPVTKFAGIGLEPGYSLIQKQWALNMNAHFALK